LFLVLFCRLIISLRFILLLFAVAVAGGNLSFSLTTFAMLIPSALAGIAMGIFLCSQPEFGSRPLRY
jgi:hypothetical protein